MDPLVLLLRDLRCRAIRPPAKGFPAAWCRNVGARAPGREVLGGRSPNSLPSICGNCLLLFSRSVGRELLKTSFLKKIWPEADKQARSFAAWRSVKSSGKQVALMSYCTCSASTAKVLLSQCLCGGPSHWATLRLRSLRRSSLLLWSQLLLRVTLVWPHFGC